jgi:hypothetical protein
VVHTIAIATARQVRLAKSVPDDGTLTARAADDAAKAFRSRDPD